MVDKKELLQRRDEQLMDVLYKSRRLPDPELDQDIALVAHIIRHAEIAAQQLLTARKVLGGISRKNYYASNAEEAAKALMVMDSLDEFLE